jgi:hypothetical protein
MSGGRVVTVNAATSTLTCLETLVANDGTSVANFELVVVTDSGPQQGIAAANISLASSRGATDTIVKVDSATNRNGRFRFTAVSSTLGNPVFTATVLGRVITQTATVQFGTVVQPAFEFTSDWGTATGTSDAALRDTDQVVDWGTLVGSNTNRSVDASTGLDFPSTNVLRIGTEWNGSGSSSFIPRLSNTLAIPDVGDSKYYRWYIRWVVPEAVTTWGTPHPIQDGPDAANANWLFECRRGTGGTKVTVGWNPINNVFPNNRWHAIDALDLNETYRVELKLTRTASTLYTLEPRVYDADGILVLDGSDFLNQTGVGSTALSSGYEFTFQDTAHLEDFQMGTNGAFQGTSSGDHPVDYCYQGCVAISADDWCGPYVDGETA